MAAATITAGNSYDLMSDPDIEIEEKIDSDLSRAVVKSAVNIRF